MDLKFQIQQKSIEDRARAREWEQICKIVFKNDESKYLELFCAVLNIQGEYGGEYQKFYQFDIDPIMNGFYLVMDSDPKTFELYFNISLKM